MYSVFQFKTKGRDVIYTIFNIRITYHTTFEKDKGFSSHAGFLLYAQYVFRFIFDHKQCLKQKTKSTMKKCIIMQTKSCFLPIFWNFQWPFLSKAKKFDAYFLLNNNFIWHVRKFKQIVWNTFGTRIQIQKDSLKDLWLIKCIYSAFSIKTILQDTIDTVHSFIIA